MKRRLLITLAIPAFALLSSMPGHAARTATYVTTNAAFGVVLNVPAGTPAGNAGVGGYSFSAQSTAPVSITVKDAAGNDVAVTVCQDLNADSVCGLTSTGEPRADICSTGGAQALSGFKAGYATVVFIWSAGISCEGIGTTGTISLT